MNSPHNSSLETGAGDAAEPSWSVDEIERLYRQALDAVDAVANDLNAVSTALSSSGEAEAADESSISVAALPASGTGETATQINLGPGAEGETPPVGPEQVIEALLFVGGKPLTIKAIGAVLRGEFDSTFIESAVERLRDRYTAQNRPYEIRLVDGGYCLALRSEFEPERNRRLRIRAAAGATLAGDARSVIVGGVPSADLAESDRGDRQAGRRLSLAAAACSES